MRWPSTGAWCQGTQDAGFRSQEPGLLCLSCALEYPGKSTMCVCVGVCVCIVGRESELGKNTALIAH